MSRRAWLLGVAGLLGGSAGILAFKGKPAPDAPEPPTEFHPPPGTGTHRFELGIDAAIAGTPVNRLLLGQNIQWTDGGDDLLARDGNPRPPMLERLQALRPTVIRFPGGAQSDTYHWARGMGPLAARGTNRHFHSGREQPTLMGTQEFLELCELVSAAPFITVNVVTGTPEEAADWLRQTNVIGLRSRRTGQRLPRVPFWEIGNEPYLKEGDKSLWLTPGDYVARANAFVRALRAVDPSVRIGIPLRTATVGGVPATPYPSFANEVLRGVREPYDFISNHNAYMPHAYDHVPAAEQLYWAAMSSSATVEHNLSQTRELVTALRPGQPALPQAITEYNALFSLGKGESDAFVASPMGGLYVADLLCALAKRDDILLAQYWSLSGNWKFGAIATDGFERPGYLVLQLMETALRGERLAGRVIAETFDAPRVGVAAPALGLPLVSALVTREDMVLRIVLINKDRLRPAQGKLRVLGRSVAAAATMIQLLANDPIRAADAPGAMKRSNANLLAKDSAIEVTLSPASIALVTLTLSG